MLHRSALGIITFECAVGIQRRYKSKRVRDTAIRPPTSLPYTRRKSVDLIVDICHGQRRKKYCRRVTSNDRLNDVNHFRGQRLIIEESEGRFATRLFKTWENPGDTLRFKKIDAQRECEVLIEEERAAE